MQILWLADSKRVAPFPYQPKTLDALRDVFYIGINRPNNNTMLSIEQYENGDWIVSDNNTGYSRQLQSREIERLKMEFLWLAKEVSTFIFFTDRIESIRVHRMLSIKRTFPGDSRGYKSIRNPTPRIKKRLNNREAIPTDSPSKERSLGDRILSYAGKRWLIWPVIGSFCLLSLLNRGISIIHVHLKNL